jgi:hypothetical protein
MTKADQTLGGMPARDRRRLDPGGCIVRELLEWGWISAGSRLEFGGNAIGMRLACNRPAASLRLDGDRPGEALEAIVAMGPR